MSTTTTAASQRLWRAASRKSYWDEKLVSRSPATVRTPKIIPGPGSDSINTATSTAASDAGGATCRAYQKAAQDISKISNDDLDWIGIATNKLHSTFLHAIFGKEASPEIILLGSRISDLKKRISICIGGLAPGGTSDSTAVKFAQRFGAKAIVNLTNVAGVYDRDPRKFKTAKLIRRMTWDDLKRQFGTAKTPGRHMPFDAAASNLAQKNAIQVAIMNGRDLKNFENFLAGKSFKGTVIR